MYFKLLLIFFLSFILLGCDSTTEDNEYFYTLHEELILHRKDGKKLKEIYLRELSKYDETKKEKFLISSKFAEISILKEKRLEQIEANFNILKLNKNKYKYITTSCNYFLARKFENSLPKSSLFYIDNAIDADEESIQKRQLPHLYHFKGRLLYNLGQYNEAISFYKKALKIHTERKQTMYVASMHNNIGLCYEKEANLSKAIDESLLAIKILEDKEELSNEENWFKNYLKEGLAQYYMKEKELSNAESLFLNVWKYAIANKDAELALKSSKGILAINELNIGVNKSVSDPTIIDSLNSLSSTIKKPEERVKFYEITSAYYLKKNDDIHYKEASQALLDAMNIKEKFYGDELQRNLEMSDKAAIENFNTDFILEKRKNLLLIAFSILIALASIATFILLRISKKKKIQMLEKDVTIAENEKKNMAESLRFQEEKIKNFHLLLNLKTQTEKTFVESLKKIRKSKDANAEDVVKDLLIRVKNLMNLDSKSIDFVNESSAENQLFINKLSEQFPALTKNDLKFCIYFRLGLASKEISLLENITEASARVYKTKIKSKMNLPKETALTDYLQAI